MQVKFTQRFCIRLELPANFCIDLSAALRLGAHCVGERVSKAIRASLGRPLTEVAAGPLRHAYVSSDGCPR
jgi:hypothetical protein